MCTTSSAITETITALLVSVSSLITLLWNCVTESPTPCGPTNTNVEPLYAYNCSLVVSHQKSPVDKPAGVVPATSAPPVVLHLVPS